MFNILVLCFCSLFLFDYAHGSGYRDFKVYKVPINSQNDVQFIQKLPYGDSLDFWEEGRMGRPSNIMVPPTIQSTFENDLKSHGMSYTIIVDDVESLLQEEKMQRIISPRSFRGLGSVTFASFMFWGEHVAYLRQLAQDYPSIASVETIGHSYEGRDIVMIKISSGPNTTANPKPAIFIDAGIHSREWIAPPVALYIIQQLVQNSSNSALYQDIDWYIVPNLNPDGYEYTQSYDRLWRKNRRLTAGAACWGTDLNRNFGHQWMVGGASNNSCTQTYAGPEPFSEPEAQAIRGWFLANGQNVKLYLTIHSYGELLLYPWGYAYVLPDDAEELQTLGERVKQAIDGASEINSNYYVNSSALGIYIAAGVSVDWVKSIGTELSYTFELPIGDSPHSFMIPARQIRPVVEETYAGIRVFWEYVQEKFVTNATASSNLGAQQSSKDFMRHNLDG